MALTALAVLCLSIAFYFVCNNIRFLFDSVRSVWGLLSPFAMGFGFAYLLIRPLKLVETLLERWALKGRVKPKARRSISILIVLILVAVFLTAVFSFVLPQLLESLSTLTNSLPGYVRGFENLINSLLVSSGMSENLYEAMAPYWKKILEYLSGFLSQLAPWIINLTMQLASKVLNTFVTLIVAIYFLYNKELFAMQLKKTLYAILPCRIMEGLIDTMKIVDETFGGYINGQLLDAIIVGTITALSMTVVRLPYALLVGVIVACTNVIPMVGPIIGAIPSTFIILMAGKPLQALIFVVLILIIQQIDGNILVPKIVGDSTGLSGFWVLFAIILAGGLFGIGGIVLCVPTLSVLFKLLKIWVEYSLRKRKLPTATSAYGKDAPIKPEEPEEG